MFWFNIHDFQILILCSIALAHNAGITSCSLVSFSHSVPDMLLCFFVKLCPFFFSFDAEPVVEIKYWEEGDSELQGDLHR